MRNKSRKRRKGEKEVKQGDEEVTHHDPSQETDPFPTVGVRDHVSVADGQEGDGDEPHGS